MEPKTQFEKNLTSYTETEVRQYFELLEELLKEAGWPAGDQRFVFTPTKDGYLNFTIGQRHVLLLQRGSSSKPTVLKFISSEQLPNLYHLHTFSGEPEMYLYGTPDPKIIRQYWSQLMSACQVQYTRSQQSSFLEKSDPSFMRAAFEREYRDQLFATADFATMFKIPFFTAKGLRFFQNRIETDQRYRKGSDQDRMAADQIKKEVYEKVNHWAELTVARLGLAFEYRPDNRWNQSGHFKSYAWARIFFRDKGDRHVYFTLSADSRTGNLVIKLDCSRTRGKLTEVQVSQIDETIAAAGAQTIIIPINELGNHDWSSLIDLTKDYIEKHQATLLDLYQVVMGEEEPTSPSQALLDKTASMKTPLNQILYGPPGTGKTYGTIRRALAIIEDKSLTELGSELDKVVKKRFDANRKLGRIGMVTFHQSFSYEDFVEGIKPVMLDEEEEVAEVAYRIEDGVFKQMAGEAESFKKMKAERDSSETEIVIEDRVLAGAEFFKMSLGNINSPEDRDIFDYCLEHDCIAMGWGDDVDFSEVKDEKELKEILQENGHRGKSGYGYVLTAIKCLKFWMSDGDIVLISNGNRRVRAIAQISGDYYFDNSTPLPFSQFRKVKWLYQQVDIPVKLVYEKNFSQASIYQMWTNLVKREFFSKEKLKEEEDQSNNYVLIIDEINRGNVSAVFGELITLLEADKRAGADNALSVDLPYSKAPFSVPSNLYLIGTMNTADRSVEALDTALRRRFSFMEVGPEPQLLAEVEIDGLDLADMLRTINHRIELLLNKDHCIGHAYFMGIAQAGNPWQALQEVFAQKVLPLLQEYFFGATGKIQLVLGKAFCSRQEDNMEDSPFAKGSDYGDGEYDDREIYRTADIMNMSLEAFQTAVCAITA